MSTKTVYTILAIVALVGGFAAITGMMSEAYATHETQHESKGECIKFANSFRENTSKDQIKAYKDSFCKHK